MKMLKKVAPLLSSVLLALEFWIYMESRMLYVYNHSNTVVTSLFHFSLVVVPVITIVGINRLMIGPGKYGKKSIWVGVTMLILVLLSVVINIAVWPDDSESYGMTSLFLVAWIGIESIVIAILYLVQYLFIKYREKTSGGKLL